jgi:hypothetical protein
MSISFSTRTSYGLVRLWHIKEELCKGFSGFSNKFPSTQAFREKIISSNHISNSNNLDEHEFPNGALKMVDRNKQA